MADIDRKVHQEVENAGADLGQPLMDGKLEDGHHFEACKTFLSEDLPYYANRVASLVGRPEAEEFFKWMNEQAKGEDNTLFKLLVHEV
jgi:hypothetical protein